MRSKARIKQPWQLDLETRYTDAEAQAVADAQIATHTADADAHHTRYTDTEAVAAILAADGSGSTLDADLLDGQHANAFAPAAPTSIPEITLSYSLTVSLGASKKYFYLPRDHFYLAGQTTRHVTGVIVDSVDKTADYGTVWEETTRAYTDIPIPGMWPGYQLPAIATSGDTSINNLTWAIKRLVTTNAETWAVTWIEKRIAFNPIQARGCVLIDYTTTFNTSVNWISQKRYAANIGLVKNRNTNGFILSGIPAGYKALLWICQAQSRTHLYRGTHWRPAMIKAPASGEDYIVLNAATFGSNRLAGVSLYNPDSGAYSPITVIGYANKGYGGNQSIRVLK